MPPPAFDAAAFCAHELAHRGVHLGHAEHVRGQRAHVPVRALGRPGPVVGREVAQQRAGSGRTRSAARREAVVRSSAAGRGRDGRCAGRSWRDSLRSWVRGGGVRWWASHMSSTSGRVEVQVPVSKGSPGALESCWRDDPAGQRGPRAVAPGRRRRRRCRTPRSRRRDDLGSPLLVERDGGGVRALRRHEARHRAPEHQCRVRPGAPTAHRTNTSTPVRKSATGSTPSMPRLGIPRHGGERPPAALEQRVVEGVLAVEVAVERRRADAHPAGDLAEGQAGDTLLGHHGQGDVEDLLDRLLPPPPTAVQRHGPGHARQCSPNGIRKSRGP